MWVGCFPASSLRLLFSMTALTCLQFFCFLRVLDRAPAPLIATIGFCHTTPIPFYLSPCCVLFYTVYPAASDQYSIEWGSRKVGEKRRPYLLATWLRYCAAGRFLRIFQSTTAVPGHYMILYCQLCNTFIFKLNRCLSGQLASLKGSGLEGKVWGAVLAW